MPPACDLGGFDWFAMFIGVAIGLALGIAAAVIRHRALEQDDFPDPFAQPYGDHTEVPRG
ncbi:hypothetical protein [Ancylobacter polymorphus]|uniref:Uncharacterized protein n=1 Tax=Ancylobacter polymorphus TaxID=223390 RepID=A0ABU0BJ06_9HYPH|nr:hypothetical protein [Ancylobacter polymorphus]MDQ0305291.1 hypothetical protein [Ancylobacter polymorphus]